MRSESEWGGRQRSFYRMETMHSAFMVHEERRERFEDEHDPNSHNSAGGGSLENNSASSSGSASPDGDARAWMEEAQSEASRRKGSGQQRRLPKVASGRVPASGAKLEGVSDESLFRQYQEGDEQAFFVIYERYKESIYAYCAHALLSAGLSRETVEDTFQDVFLRLVQYRHTFTGGDFEPWIFTVTRHSCLSIKRRSLRQHYTMDSIGDGVNFDEDTPAEIREAFSMHDDPLERMSQEEQTGLLLAAIARLPEEFREALLLSEYEGMTYDEIGHLVGASLSTIRIRIFRAKARLRKMLLPVLGDENKKL